jgi:quinol monooxygenase YgiN
MITVLVKLPFRLDQRERFATQIVPTILTNQKPDGNRSVECFESIGSRGDFLLVESWESEQAFDTWQRSEAFQAAVGALANFLAGPPAIRQFSGSVQLASA